MQYKLFVEQYLRLVDFFAQDAETQRGLIPNITEPTYVATSEGDWYETRPLRILLAQLRDALIWMGSHDGEEGYDFFPLGLNDGLSLKLFDVDNENWGNDEFFDTETLESHQWNEVRVLARQIQNTLDVTHRLPFTRWQDFTQ